jgi:GTP-binding protein EngB required for normal cell division
MGQSPSSESQAERELRWRIIQNRHEVKVAIIGERNSGKSSLINTIYRVLSQDPYGFVAEKGNFNAMKQTTNFYREHKLPANITVFDSVGANYSRQEHKEWLEKIIAGWKSRTPMNATSMKDRKNVEPKNKLDFCLLVVDPLRFDQDPNFYDYYQGLSEVATCEGVRPFIVVTKKAHPDVHITEEELKAKFSWMPSDNIWFLENYTALQQAYRSDTEKTVLMMLHNLLLRQGVGYSQSQSMFLNNMMGSMSLNEKNGSSHEINESDFHMINPSPEPVRRSRGHYVATTRDQPVVVTAPDTSPFLSAATSPPPPGPLHSSPSPPHSLLASHPTSPPSSSSPSPATASTGNNLTSNQMDTN